LATLATQRCTARTGSHLTCTVARPARTPRQQLCCHELPQRRRREPFAGLKLLAKHCCLCLILQYNLRVCAARGDCSRLRWRRVGAKSGATAAAAPVGRIGMPPKPAKRTVCALQKELVLEPVAQWDRSTAPVRGTCLGPGVHCAQAIKHAANIPSPAALKW
jgi:hypothetical protein